jgi:regulator of protease activity HflC (stomatin/prohibitin superfamily)
MDFGIDPAGLVAIILVVLALLVIFKGVVVVSQGQEYTVERFGRYTRTLRPGLHIIVPFFDKIGRRLNVMEQVLDIPTQEVITRDNASVQVDGVVFYQIMDPVAAAYEVRQLTLAIVNITMTNLRTVMGSMDLDELLSQRDRINSQLLVVLDEATNSWGVKITRVEVKDISPPADLVAAMNRQMKAERDKRAQVLEAEGSRQSEVLRAEGEKQSQILEAEGRREAAFRDAEAREREAEAEATATRLVSEAIQNGNPQAINYFIAQRYVEALEAVASAPNQKLIMMPLEASGVIGSLAGIAELAKDAFGGGSNNSPTTPPPAPRQPQQSGSVPSSYVSAAAPGAGD